MPNLGEIRSGVKLGYKNKTRYIWAACKDCGKERWETMSKSRPPKLLCRSCAAKRRMVRFSQEHNSNWKGGRQITRDGYILLSLAQDSFFYPMANAAGYVYEHRLVMAKHLGRCLQVWELVHHKGIKYPKSSKENKRDNRIENLQLIQEMQHNQLTILERKISLLESKVEQQDKFIRLLQWQLKTGDKYGQTIN